MKRNRSAHKFQFNFKEYNNITYTVSPDDVIPPKKTSLTKIIAMTSRGIKVKELVVRGEINTTKHLSTEMRNLKVVTISKRKMPNRR